MYYIIIYCHSLYSNLNFEWLIYLAVHITACMKNTNSLSTRIRSKRSSAKI